MASRPSDREHPSGLGPVLLQAALGLGAVLVAALLAGTGDARLLVPLSPAARATLPAIALDGRTSLLGGGLWPGSLVVRRGPGPHRALLGLGILSLAVPAPLCRGGA